MACYFRTNVIFLLFIVLTTYALSPPWIFDVKIDDFVCYNEKCVYNLRVDGVNEWSLSFEPATKGSSCIPDFGAVKDKKAVFEVAEGDKLYFCVRKDGIWVHAGEDLFLDAGDVTRQADNTKITDVVVETFTYPPRVEKYIELPVEENHRVKRQAPENGTDVPDAAPEAPAAGSSLGPKTVDPVVSKDNVKILGLRVEESQKEPKIVEGMIPSVLRETLFTLRLFGENLTNDTVIAFTHTPAEYGMSCDHLLNGEYKVQESFHDSAVLELTAPPPLDDYLFYICTKNGNTDRFIHQGKEKWKILATHNKLLPLWASLILIVILLMLASLFSGLNLGLMALDRTELKIIANTGTEKERKYARAIMPVRAHGNYLLCTILLSNVAVNSTFTVILDDLTSGLVAVIGSTLAIVFIAEITPQAICARHGLFVGAKSIWIMKIVMGICAPLAWPTSKLLDYFLGEEIGTHYNRERLKELVRVTDHVNDLDREEVNIISGALDLRKKPVKDVMTKLKDCFMLPINSVLDFETMSEIVKSGYSRIPVYEGSRGNIVTVLFIKDLAFVDPDDNTPLRTLCQYYQNPCNFVFEDVTLDVMLKQFKEGHKGHMAFVQRIEEGDGDPVYETVGLVTLEDVIEEMIQAEIVDETDVISDNRTKKRLARPINKFQDLAAFVGHQEHQRVHVSPQLILATFQFLNTSVDPFRPEMISETVLRRLLKQDVIQHIKLRGDEDRNDPKKYVFQEGKPVDYFVLILEGRVEVTVGRENLVFEAGPFTYFGVQALTQNVGIGETPAPASLGSLQNLNMDSMLRHTFVPDYSVRAIAELYYLTIKRSMYLAAKRATLMEKGVLNKGGTNEQIEPEVDKLLREGDRIEELSELSEPETKPFVPSSASPHTNATFKSADREEHTNNPEEEKLLKK
ncbi:hypothetical protein K1T71_014652 [Dendrolimus kikuchii]|uniref:Uncharacterized protein n=1 Tax=Dendrolimus kikuchii TaxID=765133 RepID=A0ACC1CEZ1_9NEOP|nr:hypothetical protein K1T71_014652 [Dendrolimus kikuchii]